MPKFNAQRFEDLTLDLLRVHVLTESRPRALVNLVDEGWTRWLASGENGRSRNSS